MITPNITKVTTVVNTRANPLSAGGISLSINIIFFFIFYLTTSKKVITIPRRGADVTGVKVCNNLYRTL